VSRSVPQVFDDALALDEENRAKLAAKLVESLEGEPDLDTEEAWAKEIERRLARIDAGQSRLLPAEEALSRLHRAARGQ
jgi:putative addiction module component (TIGR02574 family)